MEPLGIIEALNIVFYMMSQLAKRDVAGGMQQFSLQAFKERFHLGVVRAISGAAHAMTNLMAGQHVTHFQSPELGAAIGVQQKPCRRGTIGHSLPESPTRQVTVQAGFQLPPDNSA